MAAHAVGARKKTSPNRARPVRPTETAPVDDDLAQQCRGGAAHEENQEIGNDAQESVMQRSYGSTSIWSRARRAPAWKSMELDGAR